jgi:hypothetical protein
MSAHFKEGIWMLECLSSKHETLSSNTSTTKKKKRRRPKGYLGEIFSNTMIVFWACLNSITELKQE